MLNVLIKSDNLKKGQKAILNADGLYKHYRKFEWLEDPYVVKMIEDIDESKVIHGDLCINVHGVKFGPEHLSSGVKMLILMLKLDLPDLIYWGTSMGDNCVPYLEDIASKKDITIVLDHFMRLSDNVQVRLLNTGEITDFDGYSDAISTYLLDPLQDNVDRRRGMWLARREVLNWWETREKIRPAVVKEGYPIEFIESQWGKEYDPDFWFKEWKEGGWNPEQMEYILQYTLKAEKPPVYTEEERYRY